MTPVAKMVTSQSMIDFAETKGVSATSDTLKSFVSTYPASPVSRTCICLNPKVDC